MAKRKEIMLSVIIASFLLLLFDAGLLYEDDAYSHLARREHAFSCDQPPALIEKESRKDAKKMRLLCDIASYTCTSQKDASGKTSYTYRVAYRMSEKEKKEAERAEKRLVKKAMGAPKKKRAEFLYWAITRSMRYDGRSRLSYTPYGALVAKKACCEGASLAYADVCQLAGISCRIIIGQAEGEGHMWTAIRSGGKTLYCDPGWDAGAKKPLYFARPAAYMRDHDHVFPKEEKVEKAKRSGTGFRFSALSAERKEKVFRCIIFLPY